MPISNSNPIIGNTIYDVIDDEIIREKRFRLDGIETVIRILILKQVKCVERNEQVGPFHFETSHYIKTPLQIDAYRPGTIYAATEDEAFMNAVNTLDQFYEEAVNAGLDPDPSWLVLNPRY